MQAKDYFRGKISVWKETFAILKSEKHIPGAFVVIKDKNETTVIIDQSKIGKTEEAERDWKTLTFDLILPFGLVGFLSKISAALAEEAISIFVISAYSTDHILVREKDLQKALHKLETLGFAIET